MSEKVPREMAQAAFDNSSPESKEMLKKLTKNANREDPVESLQIMAEKFMAIKEGVDILESFLMLMIPNRKTGMVVLQVLIDKHMLNLEERKLVKDVAHLYSGTLKQMIKSESN